MKTKHQRLLLICFALIGFGVSISLILIAFRDTMVFFYTPSDLTHKNISSQQRIRLGGLVEAHSTHRIGKKVSFKVTDHKEKI